MAAAAGDVGGNISSSLPRDLNPEAVFCSQDGGLPPSGAGPFFHPAAMAPVANFYGSKSKSSKVAAKDHPATPPPSVCSSRASPILNDMARKDLSTGEVSLLKSIFAAQMQPPLHIQ